MSRLRAIASERPAFGAWFQLASTGAAELVAAERPDFACVDLQHGMVSEGQMIEMLRAITAGGRGEVVPVVRVVKNDAGLIGRALDAGAEAVIVPLVNSADDARRAAEACRYPPRGGRSWGPARASLQWPVGPAEMSDRVACFVMIETEDGLANAPEICAVEGVDGVYIGPSDLAIALGLQPTGKMQSGRHEAAVRTILAACQRTEIVAGIHSYDGATGAEYAAMGFRMMSVVSDTAILRSGARRELDQARLV